jgi:hypothetical protein
MGLFIRQTDAITPSPPAVLSFLYFWQSVLGNWPRLYGITPPPV